ncbi:hypothetical protein LTR65_010256 [Meristemomyces frigidus]
MPMPPSCMLPTISSLSPASCIFVHGHSTKTFANSSYDNFAFHLHTNTIGPIICAQRLLKSGISIGTMTFISSDSGSVQLFREMEDGFAAYGASKAALNQMARHLAAELKRKGDSTTVLLLHPGEVKTDMANVDVAWEVEGQMTPEESVSACVKTIESKGPGDSGTFWTWENKVWESDVVLG